MRAMRFQHVYDDGEYLYMIDLSCSCGMIMSRTSLLTILGVVILSMSLLDAKAVDNQKDDIPGSNVVEKLTLGPYNIEIVGTSSLDDSNNYEGYYGIKITNLKPWLSNEDGHGDNSQPPERHYPEIIKVYLAYPDNKSSSSSIDVDLIQEGNFKTIDYQKTLENTKLFDEEKGLIGDTLLSCIPLGPLASASVAATIRIIGLTNEASNQYPDQDVFYNEDIYDIRRIVLPEKVWLKGAGINDGILIAYNQGCYPGYFIKFDKGFKSVDLYYWIAIKDLDNRLEHKWLTTNGKIIKVEVKEKPSTTEEMNTAGDRTFIKIFSKAVGYSVQQTSEGGYTVAGAMSSNNQSYPSYDRNDVWLMKTDSEGNVLWNKNFGGPGRCYSVKRTNDGGHILTGQRNNEIYLIKTDAVGNVLWDRTLLSRDGGGSSVQQTTDGGYVVTGWINGEACLIKTDANGNTLWNRTSSGDGLSVQQTEDGGYITTGSVIDYDNNTEYQITMKKTDSNGNEIWNRTFGGIGNDIGRSVHQTRDGGYIIAGNKNYSFTYDECDVWLIKTDAYGNELWNKIFRKMSLDMYGGPDIQQTTDDGYIFTGHRNNMIHLIKTDAAGNVLWDRTLSSRVDGGSSSVQQTTDGGYVVTGWINLEGCLIKTDANGKLR